MTIEEIFAIVAVMAATVSLGAMVSTLCFAWSVFREIRKTQGGWDGLNQGPGLK